MTCVMNTAHAKIGFKLISVVQGSKKVPSSCPGQVDFCVGQVTFPTHLPDGQGYEQAARVLS